MHLYSIRASFISHGTTLIIIFFDNFSFCFNAALRIILLSFQITNSKATFHLPLFKKLSATTSFLYKQFKCTPLFLCFYYVIILSQFYVNCNSFKKKRAIARIIFSLWLFFRLVAVPQFTICPFFRCLVNNFFVPIRYR